MTSDSTNAPDSPDIDRVVLPRSVSLPNGRDITIRLVRPDDAPGLQRLYDELGDDDRYRRFFSPHHPEPEFFERLVAIDGRGGAAVVAEDDEGSIAAEADYELLANGNGEMAIVVDHRWRGWLGPYLVGVLSAVAAARSVPNLEAEILTTNRSMRALTRARGEALLPGSDWQTVRVEFSTAERAPGWFATDKPRVLVEMRSPALDVLDRLADDYAIVACAGPAGRPRPCPLLDGGECPLAAGADAIVIAMADADVQEALAAAHRARHGRVPVEVVEGGSHPARCDALEEAVSRAMARADGDAGHDEPTAG